VPEIDNIANVRAAYRAFNERDPDGLRRYLHPEVRWYPALAQFLDREMYEGPDAIVALVFEEIPAILEDFDTKLLDAVEPEPGIVMATLRYMGRHARTGVDVEQVFVHVLWLRDGRAYEMRAFPSPAAALAALGADQPGDV
jgi:ketosteroid isomerase-like protein